MRALHTVFICISNSFKDNLDRTPSQRFEAIYVRIWTVKLCPAGRRARSFIFTDEIIVECLTRLSNKLSPLCRDALYVGRFRNIRLPGKAEKRFRSNLLSTNEPTRFFRSQPTAQRISGSE